MSLDKAIRHGKEWRQGYRDSRRFDASCRNHGSCPRCRQGRLYARRKAESAARAAIQEWGQLPIDFILSDMGGKIAPNFN